MIKRLPRPIISEENQFELDFYSWLNDSHYWIEKSNGGHQCEWCGQIQPQELNHSTLCQQNPEIVKLRQIIPVFSEPTIS